VSIISGYADLAGITRCIKMGAERLPPQAFSTAILRARVDACLGEKSLRDLASISAVVTKLLTHSPRRDRPGSDYDRISSGPRRH